MSEEEDEKAKERVKRLVSGGSRNDGSKATEPIELADSDVKETLERHLKSIKKQKTRKTAVSSASSIGEFTIQSEEEFQQS